MVYDFIAKIKDIGNAEMLDEDTMNHFIADTHTLFEPQLDILFRLPEAKGSGELLVKSKASVSSIPQMHDRELDEAIASFTGYLNAIAKALNGTISDGFYNNSKTFNKLF